MSDFDKIIQGESRNLYKMYAPILKARYKTEEAAIAGVASAIRAALAKYEGVIVDATTKAQIQGDIERVLQSMVAN